jgi:hypothetical protein
VAYFFEKEIAMSKLNDANLLLVRKISEAEKDRVKDCPDKYQEQVKAG